MKKKVSFQLFVEFEKKIVREENEIEKNENESEDGVVEHSKVDQCYKLVKLHMHIASSSSSKL